MPRMQRSDAKLRLAIISTPRAGNNWLQNLLSRIYDVPRLSPVNVPNVEWSALPPSCVMILHWWRDPALLGLLKQHRFQILTMARHPFDVLISILHYSLREPTSGWLQEAAGGERAIRGLSPCSGRFIDYASGPRAAALLSVTAEWWQDPHCQRVRYEELVRDPHGIVQQLVTNMGVPCRNPVTDAVAECTLPRLRDQFPQRAYHFWQGQPDLWRSLLPPATTARLADAHRECLATLEYATEADRTLTEIQAEANWRRLLELPEHGDIVVPTLQKALDEVQRDLEQTRAELARIGAVGPTALRLASRLRHWAERFPRLTGAMKKWFGCARIP